MFSKSRNRSSCLTRELNISKESEADSNKAGRTVSRSWLCNDPPKVYSHQFIRKKLFSEAAKEMRKKKAPEEGANPEQCRNPCCCCDSGKPTFEQLQARLWCCSDCTLFFIKCLSLRSKSELSWCWGLISRPRSGSTAPRPLGTENPTAKHSCRRMPSCALNQWWFLHLVRWVQVQVPHALSELG